MPVSIQSRFLAMLQQGHSAKSALETARERGASRDDFDSILNSYQHGSYKSHLENGTLDDYRYGLLKEQHIERADFQRYMNRVFGHKTPEVSSGVNPFDKNGQAILNDGSVIRKQQQAVISVPEQDRENGYQSLVVRSLAEIATRRSVPETTSPSSSDSLTTEATLGLADSDDSTTDVLDQGAEVVDEQEKMLADDPFASVSPAVLPVSEQETHVNGFLSLAELIPESPMYDSIHLLNSSIQDVEVISASDNSNVAVVASQVVPPSVDLGTPNKSMLVEVQAAGVSSEKLIAAFSVFQNTDYFQYIDSLYEESVE